MTKIKLTTFLKRFWMRINANLLFWRNESDYQQFILIEALTTTQQKK